MKTRTQQEMSLLADEIARSAAIATRYAERQVDWDNVSWASHDAALAIWAHRVIRRVGDRYILR